MAEAVAGHERLVLVVGPAGAGKTTALCQAARLLGTQGCPVIGLAPSGKAADVLATETGWPAATVAKLLYEHDRPDGPEPAWRPAAGSVKLPKREHRKLEPWPVEQVEAAIDALPERYRGVGVVAAGCGLRQGEVFGLRFRDVDFLRRQVHVEQQVKIVRSRLVLEGPKGSKTRTVPLPDVVAAELAQHLSRNPVRDDHLMFTTREHNPINRNHFNPYTWKPALEAAGVACTTFASSTPRCS